VLFIGDGSGTLWALDAQTGELEWLFEAESGIESSPTYHDGTVYVGSNDNKLYAIDASNGKQRWNFTTDGTIKSSVSLVEMPGSEDVLLVFGSYDNHLYGLDTEGNEVWSYKAMSFVHGKPAIVGNLTFTCSCDNNVYAVNVFEGEKVWNVSIDDYSGVSPSGHNDTLYTAGRGGAVYAIDVINGTIEWDFETNGTIEASPSIGQGKVFIGNLDGDFVALDMESGKRDWVFRTPGTQGIQSSSALVGGHLFFGDNGGILHALQATDGKEVLSFTSDGGIVSSPAVAYGKVYFGTKAGTVYALGDTKPGVQIMYPRPWQKVNKTVTVEIEAYGIDITSVEVKLDEKDWSPALQGSDRTSWTYEMDSKKLSNGEHLLTARATNSSGSGEDTIYIIVKNKKPNGHGFIPTWSATMFITATVSVVLSTGWWAARSARKGK
jgi:outer membrane protein assembly factor BamB